MVSFALLAVASLGFGPLSSFLGPSFPFAHAKVITIAVDDASPDPLTGQQIQYTPASAWKAGTWHEGVTDSSTSVMPKASFSFEGTSFTVHCLVEDIAPMADWDLAWYLLFSVDNLTAGAYGLTQIPTKGGQGHYSNVQVYSSVPMPMGNHTVEITGAPLPQSAIINGSVTKPMQNKTVVILDYIEYTVDTDKLPASITVPSSLPPLPSFTLPTAIDSTQTSTGTPTHTSTSNALSGRSLTGTVMNSDGQPGDSPPTFLGY
ncbi:hypothetical protein GY45DRAFT_1403449 [Cubamyces sp. BRFM 1775]|nr:hypothetical protein GY45DRAFT_1403449 [Cubamyces sp. BRFM 1775]